MELRREMPNGLRRGVLANDAAGNVIETHPHKGELRASMIVRRSRPLAGSDAN